ncbi:MAG: hypothetical protein AABZ74_00785 [Cyanobacteriota bacterium]
MLKKSLKIVIICLFISSCSNPINNISPNLVKKNEITTKESSSEKIIANFDLKDILSKDIENIQIDNKKVEPQISKLSESINIPFLAAGKHVVTFTHKKYGEFSIPVDIKESVDNNFQINPKLTNDKVESWEVIVYDNKTILNPDIQNGETFEYPFPGNFVINLPKSFNLNGYRASAITNETTIFPLSKYVIKNDKLILDRYTFKNESYIKLYLIDDTGKGVLLNINYALPIIVNNPPIKQPMPNQPKPNFQNNNQNSQPLQNQPRPNFQNGNNPPIKQPMANQPKPNNVNNPPIKQPIQNQPKPNNQPLPPPAVPNQPRPNFQIENTQPKTFSDGTDIKADIGVAVLNEGKTNVHFIENQKIKFSFKDNTLLSQNESNKLKYYTDEIKSESKIDQKTALPLPKKDNGDGNGYVLVTSTGEIVNFIEEKDFKESNNVVLTSSKS